MNARNYELFCGILTGDIYLAAKTKSRRMPRPGPLVDVSDQATFVVCERMKRMALLSEGGSVAVVIKRNSRIVYRLTLEVLGPKKKELLASRASKITSIRLNTPSRVPKRRKRA
jgi:hypothetical protein